MEEQELERSAFRTHANEQALLANSATQLFGVISSHLLEEIQTAAPSARVQDPSDGAWAVYLAGAHLQLSSPEDSNDLIWKFGRPPFTVIAHTSLGLKYTKGAPNWQGRSHSLWYCDAKVEGEFGWFEVAFMTSPLIVGSSIIRPFAMEPGRYSADAVSPAITNFQLAWPFERLDPGNLEEFIERWIGWLADFSLGNARCPSSLPEKPAEGSWRRR